MTSQLVCHTVLLKPQKLICLVPLCLPGAQPLLDPRPKSQPEATRCITTATMPSSSSRSTGHRWHLNYLDDSTNVSATPQPSRTSSIRAAVEKHSVPPGFPSEISARDPAILHRFASRNSARKGNAKNAAPQSGLAVAYNISWSVAFAPIRSLLTSAFALFMTGSSVQFFSVATTVTVLFMHVQAVFSVGEAFRPVVKAGLPVRMLIPQALVHILLACTGVGVGLYKAHLLGFLPTTQSDWVSLLPLRTVEDGYLRIGAML